MTQKLVLLNKRTSAPPLDPGGQGLWDRFTYTGSIRFPHHKVIASPINKTFDGIRGYTFCYDSVNDNFLAGCNSNHRRQVIRLSFPTPSQHNGSSDGLPFATVLMPDWVDITDGQWTTYGADDKPHATGNITIHDGKVWWVQQPGYNVTSETHPVLGHSDNTTDLLNLNGVPPWETTDHYKRLCRCLCVIGETWANANVGGKRFMMVATTTVAGNQYVSIGPGAIAVEVPTTPGQIPTTETLCFWPDPEEDFIWPTTGLFWHDSHGQMSFQWIEDGTDDWVIMNGIMNEGDYGYKTTTPCGTSGGYNGYPWVPYLMVYHADDFLPVLAGSSSRIYPREIIDCREFFIASNSTCHMHDYGIAWDAARKRLWVMEPNAYDATATADLPVIHALDLDAA